MPSINPAVDAYILAAAPFAQPILEHLRALVHEHCPECQETIKWGMPFFELQGNLCHMAAFKKHCAFGFWKGELAMQNASNEAMGQLGRITALRDLPQKSVLQAALLKAAELNRAGVPAPRGTAMPKPAPTLPKDFSILLKGSSAAQAFFKQLSPAQKREYLEWFDEAKTDTTRGKRQLQALEWLADGKTRNWKYSRTKRGE